MNTVALIAGLLCLVPFVWGSRDDVINQMVMDIDANGDGMVTENELHSEFVIIMDTNQDWTIDSDEFLNTQTGWPSFYGDSVETSRAFFDNLDVYCLRRMRRTFMSGCGRLGPGDIIMLYQSMDQDGDQIVTTDQLRAKMQELYPQ